MSGKVRATVSLRQMVSAKPMHGKDVSVTLRLFIFQGLVVTPSMVQGEADSALDTMWAKKKADVADY